MNHISIYHLEYKDDDTYRFYVSHRHMKKLLNSNFMVHRIGSSALLFFLLSFFRHAYRLAGMFFSILLFCYLGNLSWGVKINGTREMITEDLMNHLSRYDLDVKSPLKDKEEIENIQKQILVDYANEIDWLNLYLDGHVYEISYTPKVISKKEEASFGILIASDDAVIERIDVSKGNVLVKKNQHVKKGDILVTNEIISTNDEKKLIETKGKIYGYIYKTYEASTSLNDEAEDFSYLHSNILEEVKKEIGEEGFIAGENVLHYEAKEGTITLRVQFTLYKNIAIKESFHEQ